GIVVVLESGRHEEAWRDGPARLAVPPRALDRLRVVRNVVGRPHEFGPRLDVPDAVMRVEARDRLLVLIPSVAGRHELGSSRTEIGAPRQGCAYAQPGSGTHPESEN